ncbi:MAG: hypothetical protein NTX91_02085 [candidate division SR1 bacterium]|nr:hypothetical protein [candidate division SR1 bacterium]
MKKFRRVVGILILGGVAFFVFSGKNENLLTSVLSLPKGEDIVKLNVSKSSNMKAPNGGSPTTGMNRITKDLAIVSGSVIVDQFDCLDGAFSGTRLINVRYKVINLGNVDSAYYFAQLTTPYISPYSMNGLGTPLPAGGYINWAHGINLPGGSTSISIKILPTTTTSLNGISYTQIPGLTNRSLDQRPQNNSIDIKPVDVIPCP